MEDESAWVVERRQERFEGGVLESLGRAFDRRGVLHDGVPGRVEHHDPALGSEGVEERRQEIEALQHQEFEVPQNQMYTAQPDERRRILGSHRSAEEDRSFA